MAKPVQIRAIDPFSEYNSNVHNMLTRILSQGNNCLISRNSLNVIPHPTYPETKVIVTPGVVIKDDVMLQITEETVIDFDNNADYFSPTGGFNETGWYYICLEYTYVKARPAPEAYIKILRPSQRGNYSNPSSILFLKAIYTINNGSRNVIDQNTPFSSFDPQNVLNKREYVYRYVSTEPELPSHEPNRDPSRFVYEEKTDSFWLGYANRWEQLSNNTMATNTSGVSAGELCFINSSGVAQRAISTSASTRAEMVAVNSSTQGQAKLFGFVENVPVQTAITFFVGDIVYLSATQAGRVTNIRPATYQIVGRCTAVGTGVIDMLFIPGPMVSVEVIPTVKYNSTISVIDWTPSGISSIVYYDALIPNIGSNSWNYCVKDANGYVIEPYEMRYLYSGGQHRARISMASRPNDVIHLTIIG